MLKKGSFEIGIQNYFPPEQFDSWADFLMVDTEEIGLDLPYIGIVALVFDLHYIGIRVGDKVAGIEYIG